jgi:N-dimethylarginine dimethylaminohydrolase
MHEAFGLRATLLFDLAPGEYHTNVVLAVLAGRAAILCPRGFADADAVEAIAALYAPHAVLCSEAEHAAFVGNAIAVTPDRVWMSAQAGRTLDSGNRERLRAAGFEVASVELDAIEAGGGSLRCCVGEIF